MLFSGSFSLSSQLNFTQSLRVFPTFKTLIGPVIFRLAVGGFQDGSVRLQSHQCSLNEDKAEQQLVLDQHH